MNVQVKNICKRYGKKTVLDGASFEAESGERVGILGANGSGKSTLLSILAGIFPPQGGQFLIDGSDVLGKGAKRLQSAVGFVPQGTPLIEELSARDNLLLWYTREQMDAELRGGVLSLLGIDEFLRVPVRKMSGGMKKRLSIGCAVASRPSVLLMDEPTAALDLVCKEQLNGYLDRFEAAGGITIATTHDASEIDLCDRLYILKGGKLEPYIHDGNTAKLTELLLS